MATAANHLVKADQFLCRPPARFPPRTPAVLKPLPVIIHS